MARPRWGIWRELSMECCKPERPSGRPSTRSQPRLGYAGTCNQRICMFNSLHCPLMSVGTHCVCDATVGARQRGGCPSLDLRGLFAVLERPLIQFSIVRDRSMDWIECAVCEATQANHRRARLPHSDYPAPLSPRLLDNPPIAVNLSEAWEGCAKWKGCRVATVEIHNELGAQSDSREHSSTSLQKPAFR